MGMRHVAHSDGSREGGFSWYRVRYRWCSPSLALSPRHLCFVSSKKRPSLPTTTTS